MSPRTGAAEALERLAWQLNYHTGDSLSTNQLAKETDLSWATVRKYTKLLEKIQNIVPRLSVNQESIKIGGKSRPISSLFSEPAAAVAVYILFHAERNGGATEPIEIATHNGVLDEHEETLDSMESLGWIRQDGEVIQLTPLGVAVAGPARSHVLNAKSDPSEEVVVYRRGSEHIAVIERMSIGDLPAQATHISTDEGQSGGRLAEPILRGDRKLEGSDDDYRREWKSSKLAKAGDAAA